MNARRTGRIVAAALGLLLVVLVACELLEWRFLRGFAEQRFAAALQTEVRLGEPFRLRLLRPPELQVASLRLGAPPASQVPFLLDAQGLRVAWRWLDLIDAWRGQPLHVRVLEARRLEAHLRRIDAETASWRFGPPKSATDDTRTAVALPVIERLVLGDGRIHVDDALTALTLEVRARLARDPADGDTVQIDASGRYRTLPVEGEARVAGFSVQQPDAGRALRLVARARAGDASFDFDGRAQPSARLVIDGDFGFKGVSLAAIGEPLGVTLPTTGPFSLKGHVAHDTAEWKVRVADARVGGTRLAGDFAFDPAPKPPRLTGRLEGPRLALKDLGPAIGGAAPNLAPARPTNPPRLLPQRDFDIPSLSAMDADVQVQLGELELGTGALEAFKPLKLQLSLKQGALGLGQIDAGVAGGRLQGEMGYDGAARPPAWRTALRMSGVDLAGWVKGGRRDDAPAKADRSAAKAAAQRQKARAHPEKPVALLTGKFDANVRLSGRGRSTAEVLASLDGQADVTVQDGTVSHMLVEFGGIDLAQGLGMFVKGDDNLPLRCALMSFEAKQGVVRPRAVVLDTQDSTVVVDGRVDLNDEHLDLTARVHPKDFTPFSVRSPLRLTGTLADPGIGLEPAPVARRAAAAAALALVNPFAAVLAFFDTGDKSASNNCRNAVERLNRTTPAKRR